MRGEQGGSTDEVMLPRRVTTSHFPSSACTTAWTGWYVNRSNRIPCRSASDLARAKSLEASLGWLTCVQAVGVSVGFWGVWTEGGGRTVALGM